MWIYAPFFQGLPLNVFGLPSSDELASLDSGSAYRFSERGIHVIVKCFTSLAASRTYRTYAAMVSSLASYALLS